MRTAQGYGLLLVLLVSGLGANWAGAQNYPSRPIHIHTTAPGATPDTMARLLATELTGPLGQPIVVENRAQGAVLYSGVARSAPDGHTLMVTGGAMWIAPRFQEQPYDPIRDFSPITTLTRGPYLIVVNGAMPVKTVADLIRLAKARPGELNYSSGTDGGPTHVAGELLKSLAGVNITRITYRAGGNETVDLLSGQVHMTIGTETAPWGAHLKTGKLRAIAMGGATRSPMYPDLPAVAETVPGYQIEQLLTFFAAGKTPDPIIRRLNQETARVLQKPAVREILQQNGEVVGGSPEQLADAVKAEVARVDRMIKQMGIKPGA